MRYFNYLKLPVASTSYVVLFLLLIVIFSLFLMTIAVVRKIIERRRYRVSFFKEAFSKGLTETEAEILWDYSLREGRDPFLTLEFKVAFEKVVDSYLQSNPEADESIVKSMREKLGFDTVPFFVPLVSTKDIELFQPARIELPDGYSAEVTLFDKDEKYMYWAFTDPFPRNRIRKGDEVVFVFIRKADAIYKFKVPVEEIYEEGERIIIKVPHTFSMQRYQRRNFARVEVDIRCKVGVLTDDGWKWYEGRLKDISGGGARVCVPNGKQKLPVSILSEVKLEFFLEGKHFSLNGNVVNEDLKEKVLCFGVQFSNIKESEQQFILKFVKKEQKKLAELYVRNRQ
ncbi:flagellar brake protein [Desulfurobacterium sp.]